MGTRYALTGGLDYCFSPKHVVQNGKHLLVPCQKCDGCLLHKANQWSRRISNECDHSVPVFFTLTYNNKYLPKLFPDFRYCFDFNKNCSSCTLKCINGRKIVGWYSDHDLNVRFNTVNDVRREDHIYIKDSVDYHVSEVTDWNAYPTIQYCSKRDIQLWLKLIQKALYERYSTYGNFRYFVIGELGPLTLRSHCHGILFFKNVETALFVKECLLFQSWQMCDPMRCIPYIRISDGRIGNYVSNYVTGINRLPRVYQENRSIRPFRLASKAPAIGYSSFSVEEIFEAIARRTIEYVKPVQKLGTVYVLRYPSDLCRSIFPKAFRYAERDFDALLHIYGCIFICARIKYTRRFIFSFGLLEFKSEMDRQAANQCYRIVNRYRSELGLTPWLYLFWLDQYYYLSDMYALRLMYLYEEKIDFTLVENKIKLFLVYSDISVVLNDKDSFSLSDLRPYARVLHQIGLDYSLFQDNPDFLVTLDSILRTYRCEVEDILNDCQKESKYKEKLNIAPTSVY